MTTTMDQLTRAAADQISQHQEDGGALTGCAHVPAEKYAWGCLVHPIGCGVVCPACHQAHHHAVHLEGEACGLCGAAEAVDTVAELVPLAGPLAVEPLAGSVVGIYTGPFMATVTTCGACAEREAGSA